MPRTIAIIWQIYGEFDPLRIGFIALVQPKSNWFELEVNMRKKKNNSFHYDVYYEAFIGNVLS